MMQNRKIAVFILTHGRPDNVITYETLRKQGYTGKIYLICDDEDKTLSQYKEKYKNEVIVFSKKDYEGKFDIMDNFKNNKVIVYARNACYDIARSLGLDYFFEYEDDYTSFNFRYIDGYSLKAIAIGNLDGLLNLMIDCLDKTNAATIAFSQAGDFPGGANSFIKDTFKRKAMNSFVFKVNEDRRKDVIFIGRMNDDVNAYLTNGKIGKLFCQITNISLVQKMTQSNNGGNSEAYRESGTYVKSFYSVMASPSCCKIDLMGKTNMRIHHKIKWKNAVPKIINETFKKT